jgi:N-acetylmuramoyl-L-alanine amidase
MKQKEAKIAIEAGHGGKDAGAVRNGLVEKTINLVIADAMAKTLKDKYGVKVLRIRTADEHIELYDRCQIAKTWGATFVISCHVNSAEGSSGDGFEAIYPINNKEARDVGLSIAQAVVTLGQNFRRVFTRTQKSNPNKNYHGMINFSNPIPALILEAFFLNNPKDAVIGDTVEKQKAFGVAYAEGLAKYYKWEALKMDKPTITPIKPIEPTTAIRPNVQRGLDAIISLGKTYDEYPEFSAILNNPDEWHARLSKGEPVEEWLMWVLLARVNDNIIKLHAKLNGKA